MTATKPNYDLTGWPDEIVAAIKSHRTADVFALDLSSNGPRPAILDLRPLAEFPNLIILDLDGTGVDEDRLAALNALPNPGRLTQLYLADASARDLSALKPLSSLQTLNLAGFPGSNLAPLGEIKSLRRLDLHGCGQITDLSGLKGLRLEWLNLEGTKFDGVSTEDVIMGRVPPAPYQIGDHFDAGTKKPEYDLTGWPKDAIEALQNGTANETTTLDFTGRGRNGEKIKDFSALQEFTALKTLNLTRCDEIGTLPPLAGLEHLQCVFLGGSSFSDLGPLAGMKSLTHLDVSNTPTANLSPLEGSQSLVFLDVSATPVADLTPLKDAPRLRFLNARACTELSDFPPLGTTSLQSLDLAHTKVSDISHLQGMKSLSVLYLNYTKVEDLSPLKDIELLGILDLSGCNNVANLTPLAAATDLKLLDISATGVADLTPLKRLSLRQLNINSTKITDLAPLAGMKSLEKFGAANTPVTDLGPLKGLNELVSVGLTACRGLTDLTPLAGAEKKLEFVGLTETPFEGVSLKAIKEGKVPPIQEARKRPVAEVAQINGDTWRPGMPKEGWLVRYGVSDRWGWTRQRCFADRESAEKFAAEKSAEAEKAAAKSPADIAMGKLFPKADAKAQEKGQGKTQGRSI